MGRPAVLSPGDVSGVVVRPGLLPRLMAMCKVYNVLALLVAQDIVGQVPAVREATVYVLSQIGAPLDQPLVATALVRPTNDPLSPGVRADVQSVLDESLAHMHDVCARILNRELTLF